MFFLNLAKWKQLQYFFFYYYFVKQYFHLWSAVSIVHVLSYHFCKNLDLNKKEQPSPPSSKTNPTCTQKKKEAFVIIQPHFWMLLTMTHFKTLLMELICCERLANMCSQYLGYSIFHRKY